MVDMKTCTKCKELKFTEDFYPDKTKKDGVYSSCKLCQKDQRQKHWKNLDPDERLRRNLKRYNLTVEQYYDLVALQEGRCAICNIEPVEERPYVDHCHDTGIVRGLLCSSCNFGIGHFKNDPKLLQKAIDYLSGQ